MCSRKGANKDPILITARRRISEYMPKFTRRTLLKSSIAGVAGAPIKSLTPTLSARAEQRKGRIRQSVSRWCYQKIPLDELARYAAQIGLRGVDLLQPAEYEIPPRDGVLWSVGYAGGGGVKS